MMMLYTRIRPKSVHLCSFQTFPSPLCFNKETKGFEVVSDAKREIAKQIKAAIRSQKRTPKIYKVVKNHSYAPIPLIPIEPEQGPDSVAINTTYSVMVSSGLVVKSISFVACETLPTQ